MDGNTAKLYGYRDEKLNLQFSAQEILGDLDMTKAKINKELGNTKYQEIIEKRQELLHDISTLESEINQFISGISDLSKYSQDELFNDKYMELITLSSRSKNLYDQAEYLRLRQMQIKWDQKVDKYQKWGKDAAALWKLASSKFTDGLDYIENNGQLINKVEDLHDDKLEKFIQRKLKSQKLPNNTKGIVFEEYSSLSLYLEDTSKLKNYIYDNWDKLTKNKRLPDSSLEFHAVNAGINAHLSLHRADIIDLYIDKDNILHMKIIDTIDYNWGEYEVAELRELQENGFIENYYVIINIAIILSDYK